MSRTPLSRSQRRLALGGVVLGLVFVVLGTWGPFAGVWVNGMIPVNVLGGLLAVLALILLVVGPARRDS